MAAFTISLQASWGKEGFAGAALKYLLCVRGETRRGNNSVNDSVKYTIVLFHKHTYM